MSQTTNLQLNKHDNPSTNENAFDIENYLNANWDKIDEAVGESAEVIQELEQEIQSLKEASYKVTGTGTDITLNNTSNNKFLQLDVKGNTEQTQYSGKNLLPIINQDYNVKGVNFKATNQGKLLINGTANNIIGGSDFIGNNFAKMTLSAGTYVFSRNIANSKVSLGLVKSDGTTSIATLSRTTTILSTTFTLNEETDVYLYFYISTNDVVNNYEVEIMVEQGSTATDFEQYCGGIPSPNPTFPQSIKNVTGDVNIRIQNKNLLYNTLLPFTQADVSISCENDIYELNGTASYNSNAYIIPYATPLMHVEAGDSITFYIERVSGTSKVYFTTYLNPDDGSGYDYNWGVTLNENVNSYKVVKTATKSGYIDHVQFFLNKDVVYNSKVKILIQKGNITNPTWVAHQEQNLPFTLGTQRLYEGSYLADDGIYHKSKRVILDGTETWSQNGYATTTNAVGFLVTLDNIVLKNTGELGYLSNRFTAYAGSRWASNIEGIVQMGTKQIMIKINKSRLESENIAGFKTWLSNNNVIVEYELETEETETYTETQQAQYNAIKEAMSYYGQTNISSTSNEVSVKIDATAIGDLNLVIS